MATTPPAAITSPPPTFEKSVGRGKFFASPQMDNSSNTESETTDSVSGAKVKRPHALRNDIKQLLFFLLSEHCAQKLRECDVHDAMGVMEAMWNNLFKIGVIDSTDDIEELYANRSQNSYTWTQYIHQTLRSICGNCCFAATDPCDYSIMKRSASFHTYDVSKQHRLLRLSDGVPARRPEIRGRYEEDFEEIERLARGGYGSVYHVRNKLDGQEYAIKKVRLLGLDMTERVFREVKHLARLDHPNVIRYFAAWIEYHYPDGSSTPEPDNLEPFLFQLTSHGHPGTAAGRMEELLRMHGLTSPPPGSESGYQRPPEIRLHIQMKLCTTSLRDWLERPDRTRIDRRVSWNLFFQILAGFRHIHAHGLVHRDCKPANILLQSGPGGPSDLEVKVGDFGLAKDLRSGRASAPLIGASDLLIAASTSTPAPTMAGRSAQTQSSSEGSGSLSSSSESYPTTVPMAVPTPNHLGDGAGGGSTSAGHSFSTTSCLRGSTIYGRSAPAGTFSPLLAHVSHTGRIGTKIYTAPEQESKRGEYSSKADVFSLGIVLFELFYIFPTKMERSKVLSDLRAGSLPTGFSESWPLEAKTILWMMSPGPEARPTADELFRTLQADPDLSTSLHIG